MIVEISCDVDIKVCCVVCGNDLKEGRYNPGANAVEVYPCQHCIDAEYSLAYDDGHEDGYNAGYGEGQIDGYENGYEEARNNDTRG
jgi:hypothetical protein